MTTQISINITHGSASVGSDDKDRAEAAALKVLDGTDADAAFAEYRHQIEELGGIEGMTGLAALWLAATQAADLALTEGWYNPDGASCEISA